MSVDDLKSLIADEVQAALESHLTPPTPLKTFKLKEAAELIGIHFHTLRTYAKKGLIDSFYVGNQLSFTLAAINSFIAKGGSTEPTQQPNHR